MFQESHGRQQSPRPLCARALLVRAACTATASTDPPLYPCCTACCSFLHCLLCAVYYKTSPKSLSTFSTLCAFSFFLLRALASRLCLSLHWMQPSLLFSVSLFFLLVCVGTVALSHYGYRNGGVSSPLEVPCRCRLARIGKLLLFSLWRPTITRSARHYECGNIGRNHRPTLLRGLQLVSTLGPSSILQLHPLESIQ